MLPTNSTDFTKRWRKLKENSQKYKFLLDIGGDKLLKIFHAEISFGLLGDILGALNQCLNPSDSEAVAHILTCLSQTNRFSLSLDFLSKSEKTQCSELLQKLEMCFVESVEQNGEKVDKDSTDGKFEVNQHEDQHKASNSNSSNSKTISSNPETGAKDRNVVPSGKEKQQNNSESDSVAEATVAKEIVCKETLDRIKNIYKVLPVGQKNSYNGITR